MTHEQIYPDGTILAFEHRGGIGLGVVSDFDIDDNFYWVEMNPRNARWLNIEIIMYNFSEVLEGLYAI